MANIKQAKKRIRRNGRRELINKMRVSRIRTFVRKVEDAIAASDHTAAVAALKDAQPEIMRGVTKGIFHKKTASRKISRLSKAVKALSA